MQLLAGQNALVTGGTAGIGRAIALALASAGASVAIVGTHVERAEQVLQEMRRAQVNDTQSFNSVICDVSRKESVETAVTALLTEWGGRIDLLVNNAGITRDGLLMRMSEADWDLVIDVNLKSVYNFCQCVIRPMMKARKGRIVNISSVVGLIGNAGQTNYAASKAGMIGFTQSLAKEVASRGVQVNCIAPGFIETRMTDELNAAQKEALLKQIPMGRMGRPEEIAEVCLFLAAQASYMTGQVLAVDGGMVMG